MTGRSVAVPAGTPPPAWPPPQPKPPAGPPRRDHAFSPAPKPKPPGGSCELTLVALLALVAAIVFGLRALL